MSQSPPAVEKSEVDKIEEQITELRKKLVEARKRQAGEKIADYTFATPTGPVKLSQLFGDKSELLVIHNMGRGCAYCTLWADEINGVHQHLENRAGLVVVSDDPPDVQKAFADSRGWKFKMASSAGTSFFTDTGFRGPGRTPDKLINWPGVSALHKSPDGTITRTAKSFFGPGDSFCGVWHLFDLLKDGVNGWGPKFGY
jgi:predicted dithiol-disulfide oxidoreductase (DUF899 family)